jgi:hypothetical protein
MPLLITAGEAHPPGREDVLVAFGVTDYVGVQPGGEAILECVYNGASEPIAKRFDRLRLVGTFDMAGPIKAGSSHSGASMRKARMSSRFGPKPPASASLHCRPLSARSHSENSARQ